MKNHIGRMVILVNDYEEAANFYEKNFGFKRIYDVTTHVGQRFLQIGADEPNSTGLWFIKADGKGQRDNVGKQTNGQPVMVIYTSSFDDLYQQIKNNNVIINVAPVNTPDYKYFHCLDLYGNEIIIVELKAL